MGHSDPDCYTHPRARPTPVACILVRPGYDSLDADPGRDGQMLSIPAKTVYVDPGVRAQDNCRARLVRVLAHVKCDDVREYDREAREAFERVGQRRHGKDEFGDDAVIAFTTYEPERERRYYHRRDEAGRHGGVCRQAMELNPVFGCVFRCAYCGFGRSIHFTLDVERFMEKVPELFRRNPTQTLYKYSNMTDLPPFEPELDAVAPMVRLFARDPKRYLMLFTKSDNVDFLLGLDHGGHTIVSWSITCETASRLVDRRAATMAERIEAMRKCQAAGYIVRARLSPIVPVRDWRREYTALVETLFANARPDIVTLELLGWMECDDLVRIIDREMLDAKALAAAEAAKDEMKRFHWGPFTEDTHIEVYRFLIETVKRVSPGTPVAVCHGTTRVWQELGSLMGMTPENYICNCGPTSAPGNPIYDAANR